MTTNPYERKARQAKATAIGSVLAAQPEVALDPRIDSAPDEFRALVATQAGVRKPSAQTWELAVHEARRILSRMAYLAMRWVENERAALA